MGRNQPKTDGLEVALEPILEAQGHLRKLGAVQALIEATAQYHPDH